MTTKTTTANYEQTSPTRRRVLGIIFLVFSALIYFLFTRTLETGVQTTFRMVPGGSGQDLPDWVFNSLPMLNVMVGLSLVDVFNLKEKAQVFAYHSNTRNVS